MNEKKVNLQPSNDDAQFNADELEIIELEERLDLATDPLIALGDGCCHNNCSC